MATRQSKCCNCGESRETSQMVLIGGKKYCPHCAPAKQKEAKEWEKIYEILLEITDNDKDIIPRFLREIQMLKKNNPDWKNGGIRATLQYAFYIAEDKAYYDPEFGLNWIIIKYYPKAKKYFQELHDLKKQFPDDVVNEIVKKPVRTVMINRSDIIDKDKEFVKREQERIFGPIIDIDSIEVEEEVQ